MSSYPFKRLRDAGVTLYDCEHKTPKPAQSGYPYIAIPNIQDGRLDLSNVRLITKEDFEYWTRKIKPQTGDIIVTRRGRVGDTAAVPEGLECAIGQNLVILRSDGSQIDQTFLRWMLRGDIYDEQVDKYLNVGAIFYSLNCADIPNFELPTPPLPEQRAIAGILGALDDKIEVNRRMNVTLESMARAVFRQWFVENDEVENWETLVLNDLAESILGGDWGKDTNEDGTLLSAFCIRGADIPDLQAGGIGKMPLRYIKPSSLEKRKLQAGDIVVEISGGSPTQSTGRPVFISDTLLNRLKHPLVASNFCRVFRPKDTMVSNFVYFWLRFLYSRDDFFQYENGTTGIKNLAFTIFCKQHYLRLPPKNMLEKYHQFTTVILEAMQSNAKESRTLGSLRDSLLPKLMRGEVRVSAL